MKSEAVQLTLERPEWFRPIPAGEWRYVPVLQTMAGELAALSNASGHTWDRLLPLIAILGPKTPGREPFTHDRVSAWVKKVANAVGERPFFLDTVRLARGHLVKSGATSRLAIEVITDQAHRRGLQFVPVVSAADSRRCRDAIASAAARDGRGVAIRYPLLQAVAAEGRDAATVVKEVLHDVAVEATGADLLLDMQYISPDVEVDDEMLVLAIEELLAVGAWRSVVLFGTGMPRSLGGGVVAEGTLGELPRPEWTIWTRLLDGGISRVPSYGDYAVQNPYPPDDGQPSGPGMRANIRYTTADCTLVPRGTGPVIVEGAQQYRDLCRMLTDHPDFAGAAYTWGDSRIVECAAGLGDIGGQSKWRGVGTSHHLRSVVEQLAAEFTRRPDLRTDG